MRIAIIGTRGIPARYGGFETFAEEIACRLVKAGHEIIVYGRRKYYPEKGKKETFRGVNCVYLGALPLKQLETASNAFFSFLHLVMEKKTQAVIICNNTNGYLLLLLRLAGCRTLINVDGLEWQRGKWGFFSKNLHRLAEKITVLFGRRSLVVDSRAIGRYYKETYGADCHYIPYGAPILEPNADQLQELSALGLEPGEYFLQVTRFVPENNVDLVLRAFRNTDTEKKMVLVGGDRYKSSYIKEIEGLAALDKRVILPGFIYRKQSLDALLANAFAYVHGNEVGGTNPALLQAMGAGNLVLAVDTVFNREVLRDCGFYFEKDSNSLLAVFNKVMVMNRTDLSIMGQTAREIVKTEFSWEEVTAAYLRALK